MNNIIISSDKGIRAMNKNLKKFDVIKKINPQSTFKIHINQNLAKKGIKGTFDAIVKNQEHISEEFNFKDFFNTKKAESINNLFQSKPFIDLRQDMPENKEEVTPQSEGFSEEFKNAMQKNNHVWNKRDAVILDYYMYFEHKSYEETQILLSGWLHNFMEDYQIPFQILGTPEALVQYIESGIIIVKADQISDFEYLQFLYSPDLTVEAYLKSRDNQKAISQWMNDAYLILRNINYLAITASCSKKISLLDKNTISTSIDNYINMKQNVITRDFWTYTNKIMKTGMKLEFYGLISLENFIEIIFSIISLNIKHTDVDGQIISLKEWLLKKPIGDTTYSSNFERITHLSSQWKSPYLSHEDQLLIGKWLGNDESESGLKFIAGLRNLISEKRFELRSFQSLFESFQNIFKLGSKDSFGIMIKNILVNKEKAQDVFPTIKMGIKAVPSVVNFINDFFQIWKDTDQKIIEVNKYGKDNLYQIFALGKRFLPPSEAQFIAIDSIIQFFIDNFFDGNTAEFNRWNVYASQKFYQGDHIQGFSGLYQSHTQLLNDLGSRISKKALLQKSFFINGQEIILQAHSFFEKDLLEDLEEISRIITKILAQESFKELLKDKNLVVSYPVLHNDEDSKTILDIGVVFNAFSQGRGLLFEALGFTQYAYGRIYSHSKEIQLLVNLINGMAPIYIPYDISSIRSYYFNAESQNVRYIGKIAPLITRSQFQSLLKALSLSGKSFSETLLLLSHKEHVHNFGFNHIADAIAIQKAFGLLLSKNNVVIDQCNNPVTELIDAIGNVNFAAFDVNIQVWWQNYANSNLEFVDSVLNKMYAQLHFNI